MLPADLDPLLSWRVLVRADGKGEFFDAPARSRQVLLWDFIDPQGANEIRERGYREQPGQLDVRFYAEYRPGAFWPAHAWKRTPKLYDVRVEYETETKVLYREEE